MYAMRELEGKCGLGYASGHLSQFEFGERPVTVYQIGIVALLYMGNDLKNAGSKMRIPTSAPRLFTVAHIRNNPPSHRKD